MTDNRPPGANSDPESRAQMLRVRLASLARSFDVYWGDAPRNAAMDALYARFVSAGDLVFDIGAHVGDRVGSFRRLGARVVALEPQKDCARLIREIFEGDADVTVVDAACGAEEGQLALHINSANATVATLSDDFVRAADGAAGWEGQVWDHSRTVPVTTLDTLIAQHGVPAFTKIDVEGFEAAVLAGLSQPLPALSFEFTTIERDVAYRCIERLAELANYRYDLAIGESQLLTFGVPRSGDELCDYISGLPHSANSGDVYAIQSE
ncbi:MAG: hypothetical protein RLZ98_2079 [Pseudomonadota bacterium]|jgi:FkbM family methyltransferase